ncbi:MAG: discoidin domain-containing protein, partial [Prevotella sp.]|nr:discoidin domain-containing protein [Prevotella sp.]
MFHIKSIKYGILLCLLPICISLNSQERIAGYNWLRAGTLTFSHPDNATLELLTDKNDATFFVETDASAWWVQCEYEEPVVISAYTLVSAYTENQDPATCKLEYSDNGSNWTTIHTQTLTFPSRNYPLNISTGLPTGSAGYTFYRLTIENAANTWSIAELQFFGRKAAFEADITDNGGTLTGQYQGLPDYNETLDKLTDNAPQKFCQTGTKSFWVEYLSPVPVKLEKYALTAAYTEGRMPRSWEILGSNDGVNYVLLDRQRNKNLFQAAYSTHYYQIDSLNMPPIDWAQCADLTYQTLISEWWRANGNNQGKYFIQTNGETPHTGYNYWWNAHALDIFVDGFQRTGKITYKARIEELNTAVLAKGGGSYWNTFYDDMEWMGLACLRAYQIAGLPQYRTLAEQLWNWIAGGWTTVNNGGIMWASGSPNSKNACSNGPAMILAARLYNLTGNEEYLTWAKRIFLWMDQYLYDASSGYIWDGYNNYNVGNVYTYNIGTWLGGCMELYLITGDEKYINRAVKSASAVVDNMSKFSPYGILYNGENGGDGGLFKCIFMRYLSQLILRGNLNEELRNHYIDYMRKNGEALWNAGTMKPEMIVSKEFYKRPDGKVQDSSVQMCGVMIFELLDELKRAGMLPDKDPTITENAKNAYRYFRLNMQANNGASDSELSEWQLFGTE